MERTYAEYAARQAMELLAIDSPTGFTARAADWVQRAFEELGYTARRTAKGGVLVDLGGRGEGLLLEAHADTLGGMVAEVKNSGRLRLTPLGGERPGLYPWRAGAGGNLPAVQRFRPRQRPVRRHQAHL